MDQIAKWHVTTAIIEEGVTDLRVATATMAGMVYNVKKKVKQR